MILASSQADPDPDMHLHVHLPTEEVGPGGNFDIFLTIVIFFDNLEMFENFKKMFKKFDIFYNSKSWTFF